MTTTTDQTYNGYTNYETWNVSLWIGNDQSSQEYWQECAARHLRHNDDVDDATYQLARQLEEETTDSNPLADDASMFSDILSAALRVVNWYEIAGNMIEQAQEG